MLAVLIYFVAFGLIFPNAAHEAVHPLPDIAGIASAVLLSSQMLFGALGGALAADALSRRLAAGDWRSDDGCALSAGALYFLWLRPGVEE